MFSLPAWHLSNNITLYGLSVSDHSQFAPPSSPLIALIYSSYLPHPPSSCCVFSVLSDRRATGERTEACSSVFCFFFCIQQKKGIHALTFQNKENHSAETLSCPVAFIMQRQKNAHFHFNSHLLRRQFNLVCLSSPLVRRSPPLPSPPSLLSFRNRCTEQQALTLTLIRLAHRFPPLCLPLFCSQCVYFFFFAFLPTPFNLFSSHFCTNLHAFCQR